MSAAPKPEPAAVPGTRAERTGLAFFALGSAMAWFFVAHGLSAVWSMPLIVAALGASLTVGIQIVVLLKARRYGRTLGLSLLTLYVAFTLLNVVLAGAGVAATVLKDRLGRASIVHELAEQKAEISAVTVSLESVAGEANRASTTSQQRQRIETIEGGSCALPGQPPSPRGEGPISRMRDSDRELFAALGRDSNALAARMQAANRQVEQAIADYSADNHQQTLAAVRTAMAEARTSAAASQEIRRQAEARLAQWRAGTPVACHDPGLERRIEALAKAEFPQVGNVGELPPVPSPGSAADRLFADLYANAFEGVPLDWELWGLPLFFGLLPDVLLVLGYAMWSYDRREAAPVIHDVTAHLLGSATDWSGFHTAASNGIVEQGLAELGRYHARKTSHFGDTDVLMIPDGCDQARPFLVMAKALAARGWARYQGLAKASALPAAMSPRPEVADDVPCHYFVLGRGVWNRIMMEAVRMAAHRAGAPA